MQDEFLFEVHEGDKCHLGRCIFQDHDLIHEGHKYDAIVWRSKVDGKILKFHTSCWEIWQREVEQPFLEKGISS